MYQFPGACVICWNRNGLPITCARSSSGGGGGAGCGGGRATRQLPAIIIVAPNWPSCVRLCSHELRRCLLVHYTTVTVSLHHF